MTMELSFFKLVIWLCSTCLLATGLPTTDNDNTLSKRVILPEFTTCPHGFVRFADSCYKAAHDLANWPDAMVYCRAYASHLAYVETIDEQNFLTAHLRNITASITDPEKYFWIGGTDAVSEGEWIWSTVYRPITYTNWNPGEPNDNDSHSSKHQDCMGMYAATGKWDDGWCETLHNFICEMELTDSEIVG
ncbi:hypothetical protein ACF0H5_011122 [Mactra antiquata]